MNDPAIATLDKQALLKDIRAIPEFKPLKPKQKRFVFAYAGTGRISTAANISGIPWITHYHWLDRDEHYKEAFDKAKEMFGDYAEGEVFNRAFFGEEHQVFKKGELVGKFNQKSDILAIFALKGLKPQYRDSFSLVGGSGPAKVNIILSQINQAAIQSNTPIAQPNQSTPDLIKLGDGKS